MRRTLRLKYLNRVGEFRSGNPRYYFRRPGEKKGIAMPDLPQDHPDFLAKWSKLAKEKPQERQRTGSIGAGVEAFLASDKYLNLAKSTRATWRRALESIKEKYAAGPMRDLRSRHIRQDLAKLAPHPANARLKVWRGLCRWWVDAGLIEVDPARDVRRREVPKSDGFTPWTRKDFQTFRDHWPIGTSQRLAFEIMHWTCAAIVDAVRLGPGMVSDGWVVYQRQKSGSYATCPLTDEAPSWAEPDGMLLEAIEAIEDKHMTWLATQGGHSRSTKAAVGWFSRACNDAGLKHLTSHGIRKGRSAIFKENGASPEKRMAWLGHETVAEAQNYSKSADLRRTIQGTKFQQKLEQLPSGSKKTS